MRPVRGGGTIVERGISLERQVILYGHDCCPGTERARRYFRKHAIAFIERDVAEPRWAEDMRKHGAFATPFLLIDAERMIGFDERLFERLWATRA